MPVINFALGQGQINQAQKAAIIERFSTAATEVTGIPIEKMVVLIDEYPTDNLGIGRDSLSAILNRR